MCKCNCFYAVSFCSYCSLPSILFFSACFRIQKKCTLCITCIAMSVIDLNHQLSKSVLPVFIGSVIFPKSEFKYLDQFIRFILLTDIYCFDTSIEGIIPNSGKHINGKRAVIAIGTSWRHQNTPITNINHPTFDSWKIDF